MSRSDSDLLKKQLFRASTRICTLPVNVNVEAGAFCQARSLRSFALEQSMPRQATIRYAALRSSLVNLPLSLYAPLVEHQAVRTDCITKSTACVLTHS